MTRHKFLTITGSLFVVLCLSVVAQLYLFFSEESLSISESNIVEIEMRVLENQWKWDPDEIKVKVGDSVRLKIFNEDDYTHGFAIIELGINENLEGKKTTNVEFVADRAGEFIFSCSVLCGKGHFNQHGKLIIE